MVGNMNMNMHIGTGSVHAWSDLHLRHLNMATKYRKLDGFDGTLETHDRVIMERWNDTVRPRDEVWVVGDEAMGIRAESVPMYARLHGVKHQIPGNHSNNHPMYAHKANYADMCALYAEHFIVHDHIIDASVIGIEGAILSHFPFWATYEDHAEEGGRAERYKVWHPHVEQYPAGMVVIHGHTHSSERISRNAVHIGLDAWPDGPVSLDALSGMVAAARAWL